MKIKAQNRLINIEKEKLTLFFLRSNEIPSNADQKTKQENTNSNTRNLKRDNTVYIEKIRG